MKYETIIVRYSEIGLKAKYTRKTFENVLIKNIKNALKLKHILFEIKRQRGRIFIGTKEIDRALPILQNIFGIKSISPALKTNSNMESISKEALNILKISEKDSFALRVTREGKHEYTSKDVAIHVGNIVVKATKAKVNLTKPDHTLYIEIRGNDAFLFEEKIECVGGLPLGTQGNVLDLVNSDKSILAAWYLMRRGCDIVFSNSNENLEKFLEKWFANAKILSVESNDFKKLNSEAIKHNCSAIVTDISLYEKDALSDIKQFKDSFDLPVLHPLISMEKKDIDKKMLEIGILE